MKTIVLSLLLISSISQAAQTPVSLENQKDAAEIVEGPPAPPVESKKDEGEKITLEDGRVFRVFEKRPTALPPKGEIFIDRASFNKMLAEEKKKKETQTVEILVKEDSTPMMEQKVEELPKLVEEKNQGMVIKSVKVADEEDPINTITEEAKKPLAPGPVLVAKEETPRTPVSVEVRQKIEEIFDSGVSEGQILTDEKTRAKVEEERVLLANEIKRNEEIKAQAKLAEEEQSALTEMQAKELNLRKNAQLSEGKEEFSSPASKEDLKVVNLSKKNTNVSINLPQPENQERQNTVALTRMQVNSSYKSQVDESDLLQEGEGFEEASGPEYGFGFEK